MRLRRLIAAALVLSSVFALGGCASTFADMWPHWAGGEPAGLPPRQGQPGYEEFIAHGRAGQNAAETSPGAQQAPGATATITQPKSAAQPQKPPAYAESHPQQNSEAEAAEPDDQPASDTSAVRGGLY